MFASQRAIERVLSLPNPGVDLFEPKCYSMPANEWACRDGRAESGAKLGECQRVRVSLAARGKDDPRCFVCIAFKDFAQQVQLSAENYC